MGDEKKSGSGEIAGESPSGWLKVGTLVLGGILAVAVPPGAGTYVLSEKLDGLKHDVRENTAASKANTRELAEVKVSMEERKLLVQRLIALEKVSTDHEERIRLLERR